MGAASGGVLWLVINLDRSPERRAEIAARLCGLGIPFTRVSAVDGRSLSLPMPGFDPTLYRASHGREMLPGEVGCTLSHLDALRRFLASPHRHAVILEDDAEVTREAVELVAALTASAALDDWDLVKLEAHHGRHGLTTRRLASGRRLCSLLARSGGSAAYLVNRDAAEALVTGLLPMRFPYDVAFERSWDFAIRIRAVLPLPVTTAPALPSTLGRASGTGEKRRAPALLRVQTKFMYVATALSAWIRAGILRSQGRRRPARDPMADRGLTARARALWTAR